MLASVFAVNAGTHGTAVNVDVGSGAVGIVVVADASTAAGTGEATSGAV